MTKLHTHKWNFKPKCDSSNTNKTLQVLKWDWEDPWKWAANSKGSQNLGSVVFCGGGGVGRGFRGLLGFGTLSLQGFRVLGFWRILWVGCLLQCFLNSWRIGRWADPLAFWRKLWLLALSLLVIFQRLWRQCVQGRNQERRKNEVESDGVAEAECIRFVCCTPSGS